MLEPESCKDGGMEPQAWSHTHACQSVKVRTCISKSAGFRIDIEEEQRSERELHHTCAWTFFCFPSRSEHVEFSQRALEGRAGGSCQGRKGLGPGLDSGQSRRPRQRTFTQATHVTCAPPLHVRAKRGSNWRVRSVLWPTPFLPSSLTIGRSRRYSLKGNHGHGRAHGYMGMDALPSHLSTFP